ncbi:MAG: sialate O-acetylesterase [Bacteroidota bacterium]
MQHLVQFIQKAILTASILSMIGCQTEGGLELPAVFSDNMVLQQNTEVTIWGKAGPGTKVTVKGEWGASSSITADNDSTWKLNVPTTEAGGPYDLTISSPDTTIRLNNVMLGEVWLASGQSNMEMPLEGWPPNDTIQNSKTVIANTDYPDIRMFTVTRNMSPEPLNDVNGSWKVATPENAGDFSATAMFFAKKLNAELDVPTGIIHSSWGGTPIESWINNEKLAEEQDFRDITDKLKDLIPQVEEYNQWLDEQESVSIRETEDNPSPFKDLDVFDDHFSNPDTHTGEWKTMSLPGTFEESEVGEFDGVIWFRKTISLPEGWDDQELTLSLGPVDDMDVTYFNGKRIGGTEEPGMWQKERNYTIPADVTESGEVELAVKVIDHQGGGGIHGEKELMKIHPEKDESRAIDLSGEWQYKVAAEIRGDQMYLFDPESNVFESRPQKSMSLSAGTPTVLYNAMINPLTPFTLQGSIWYQGESNVGKPAQYNRLKHLLIENWREQFNNPEMPFYYVQLAPWHYNNPEGRSSAKLREAQRRALEIPNTGMAVTLDIGSLETIHPANKKDVGERLALWALANDYGKDLVYSGPIPAETETKDDQFIIRFDQTDGGLVLKDDVTGQFEIAGEDGNYHPAGAEIEESALRLSSSKVAKPVNVRYAYKNAAEASLFNEAGLPAPSFSTEDELN